MIALRSLAALLTLATTSVVGAGAAGAATTSASEGAATTALRQRATVSWTKGRYLGRDRVAFQVAGIGAGELVCRPNATYLRLTPVDRTRETSMWSVLAQVKGGELSYAVKNARVYRYSTPTSLDRIPGTGRSAQEGLNLQNGVEDSGEGTAIQLISQRTALGVPAAPTAPLTSIALSWSWSGFDGPAAGRRCHATARVITKQPAGTTIVTRRAGGLYQRPGPATSDLMLDWHGEADAALGKTDAGPVQIPFLGTMRATCPTGRDADAALTLQADDPAAPLSVDVQAWEGEGPEARSATSMITDPITGEARIALPANGFLTLLLTGADGRTGKVTISSWRKTNDEAPAENHCAIAAQATTQASAPGPS